MNNLSIVWPNVASPKSSFRSPPTAPKSLSDVHRCRRQRRDRKALAPILRILSSILAHAEASSRSKHRPPIYPQPLGFAKHAEPRISAALPRTKTVVLNY